MWSFLAFVSFVGGAAALVGIAFPRVLGLSRRLHAVGLLVVAGVAFIFTTSRGVAADNAQQERERQEREAAAAAAEVEEPSGTRLMTLAETWAATARASLGMRQEAFFAQMPDDLIDTQWEQRGVDRIHTMTWRDTSVVVTYWRPSEVHGDGLRLHFIKRTGMPR